MPGTPAGHPPAQPGNTPAEQATRVFLAHRELLFSVVYDMLGTVTDTEDVLQETWVAWAARAQDPAAGEITSPRAYLVRVAVNRALAQRASISRRREEYPGPWLPEPLVTDDRTEDGAGAVERAESVSLAMLVVLETLTPLERAVFVLHEVFGYAHAEIAGIVDRSPAAVRQIDHRAREHVHARRPRYRADPRVQRQATERFLAATAGSDLDALMRVLAPDVTLWADGGGRAPAAGPHPVQGRDKVARVIVAGTLRSPIPDMGIRYRSVNGEPAAVLTSGGAPYMVISLDVDPGDGRVRGIYVVTNPGKLAHLGGAGS